MVNLVGARGEPGGDFEGCAMVTAQVTAHIEKVCYVAIL